MWRPCERADAEGLTLTGRQTESAKCHGKFFGSCCVETRGKRVLGFKHAATNAYSAPPVLTHSCPLLHTAKSLLGNARIA